MVIRGIVFIYTGRFSFFDKTHLLGLHVPEYVLSLGRAKLCRPGLVDAVPGCRDKRQNAVTILVSDEASLVRIVAGLELLLFFSELSAYFNAIKIL